MRLYMNISTGILAGGKSTRMGKNKALLEINEKRFIDKIAGELGSFSCSKTLISAAEKGDYDELGLPVVYDEHKDIGPLEGIYQLLKAAEEEYVFICAADMPFITKELVSYMAEFVSSDYDCYVLTDEEHIHPLCGIYSKKMLDKVRECIESGNYRLMKLLNGVRTKYIKLEYTSFDKKVVKNINTRAEYKELVLPAVFCVSGIKDSGKTWLIIKLINEFINEGYVVSVIKHDGHDYVMDYEGTDTFRFCDAGARLSAIFSPNRFSLNCRGEARLEEMLELVKRAVKSDIIIIEGMKNSPYPKIEVVRREISRTPVCSPESLICIATDTLSQSEIQCPVYGIDDIEGIFLCVKIFFGLEDEV